jgi:hypothetical protein
MRSYGATRAGPGQDVHCHEASAQGLIPGDVGQSSAVAMIENAVAPSMGSRTMSA